MRVLKEQEYVEAMIGYENRHYNQILPVLEAQNKVSIKTALKLYEDMGCVPEEDNQWYRFWQTLTKLVDGIT